MAESSNGIHGDWPNVPNVPHVRQGSGNSSVVQVETLGRLGLVIILVMFVVISAVAIIAGYALGVGEARAESASAEVRRLNAKVEVLQYDLQDLRAKTGNSHASAD